MQPEQGDASLDLGELRQVLQDEELAHKLQQEEEFLLRRVRKKVNDKGQKIGFSFHSVFSDFYCFTSQNSQPSPCRFYPEGDFRVAQVAQDEVR